MLTKSLLLVVPNIALADSALVQTVLSHWPCESRPELRPISFDELLADESVLAAARAAWLYCPDPASQDGSLLEADAALERAQIPGLITLAGEQRGLSESDGGGLVVGPPDADPASLCTVLRAIWAQAQLLEAMRTENRFLRAHQGGLCAEMDRIDEELRLAARLQREFLPQTLPSVNGVSFKVLYRPAGYVSGDIYDVLRLDERHIGFFLGDAVGHGVPAALMTMYIKRSLHTKELDTDDEQGYRIIPPDESLAHLNRDMCSQNESGARFATACYGVIDCFTGELVFARAGHPYPIILRTDGSIEKLSPEGAMLGIFPEEVFGLERAQLEPGDRLLIFSDGFELAFPEGELNDDQASNLANDRYEQELLDLAQGKAEAAVQRLELKLDRQAGSLSQRDDITLLLLDLDAEAQLQCPDEPASWTAAIAS